MTKSLSVRVVLALSVLIGLVSLVGIVSDLGASSAHGVDKRQPGLSINGDTCVGATTLLLNTPITGDTTAAANDYQLSGGGCFTGVGNTASTAAGRDLVYSFTAPSAGTYSFRVTNFNGSNLVVYTASTCPAGAPPVVVPSCVAAANRTSGTSEEVPCLSLAASQQIFVFVDEDALTAGGTFTLEAMRCSLESEPNDTPGTADPFIFGGQGSINPGSDFDFYSLGTHPVGSRIFALVDGVSANSQFFDVRITTTTDTLEYDDSNAAAQFGQFSATVAGTPLTAAPAFLRVDNPFGASEPYHLYATVKPPIGSAIAESESNDTIGTADTSPANYFIGDLAGPAPSTDQDVYSFTAQAGDLVFLSLDADPLRNNTPINPRLELLDSVGTVLLSVNDGAANSDTTSGAGLLTSTTPFSPAESLVLKVNATGTYYARVVIATTATDSTGAGDYLLSIFAFPAGPTAADGTVSGRITDALGLPISGTLVSLSGEQERRTITDAQGNYVFHDVETNGFYTVTPSRANYVFSPSTRSFSQLSEQTDAGFTGLNIGDAANPLDTAEFFVRQQYVDMLGREPDEGGFTYWTERISECGSDVRCANARRRDVAAAFFIEREFQQTGSFIYGLYKGGLGRTPLYSEFAVDRTRISEGPTLESLRQAFAEGFVERQEFVSRYAGANSAESFVDAIIQTVLQSSGISMSSERNNLIGAYNSHTDQTDSRVAVLRFAANHEPFRAAEYNAAFVLTEYFAYLRRDPDADGYRFWLDVLNNREPGNYRGMVCAFITSAEYQRRFSNVVSRTDRECSQ